jgi:SH3-like domain-containing protein
LIVPRKSSIWPGMPNFPAPSSPFRAASRAAPCSTMRAVCLVLVALLACTAGALAQAAGNAAKDGPAPESAPENLKALRYVSLKADRVYLRKGPGTEYPVAWEFQRAGLPVEVIREFDVWRQVRDASGTVGWVHSSLLSGRRTALILPWEVKDGQSQPPPLATLRYDDHDTAAPVAQLEAGTLVSIIACDKGWCRVSIGSHRGYIEQTKLWGTYPDESIK